MARPGITKQEVFAAANQLTGEGREPTIEQIRQHLKTGSNSTIAAHLRDWRAMQSDTQTAALHAGLPQEMIEIMKSLWERLTAEAKRQVTELEVAHQQALAALEQDIHVLRIGSERWEKSFAQKSLESEKLTEEKQHLQLSLTSLQQDKNELLAKLATYRSQMEEKQERIEELRRLQAQAQANLEHYRETTREQRLIEQQQFEQQKIQLQSEIKMLTEQQSISREKLSSLQYQHQTLQQSQAALVASHEELALKFDKQSLDFNECLSTKNEFKQHSQYWENQCVKTQENLESRNSQFFDLQADVRVLSQQLADARAVIAEVNERNKLLDHDKWLLTNEKAQLEGQLHQVNKLISA